MRKGIFNDALTIDQTVHREFIHKEDPTNTLPVANSNDEIIQRLHFDHKDKLIEITYHSKES